MRRSIAGLGAIALTLTLAACGGSGTETKPSETPGQTSSEGGGKEGEGQKITVWVDETRVKPVEAAAKKFKDDTGATIEIVQKNFDDIRAEFNSQVPTGKGPDITVGAHDWLGEMVKNGVVAPIELGDKAKDFQKIAVEAFTNDGKVYAVPYAVENIGLIRNTKLASEAPATFDDMVKAGKDAGTKYPFLIQVDAKGDPYTMAPFQHSFGAMVFKQNDDGSYTNELNLGGEPGHKFANWLKENGKNGSGVLSTSITYDIAVEQFKQGNAPFIIGGPWMLEQYKDLELAIDPIPTTGDKPAAPFVGVQGFYLNAKSPNALLANRFLSDYIGSKDIQVEMFKAGGRVPALQAAADDVKSDPIVAGFAKVAEQGVPMPSIPEMGAVWNFWGVTEAQIINGEVEPTAGWDKMVSDIEAAIK
ncbi:maltose ABC transporter substrate-binding protein [Bowdeniella nasicola]|uniref:Maltose ABC transporter substrate-binding protein n=1 Tax=Bowdeniella nasicola TaxID=208480 RepID=A0A1Q5Q2V6_9ACTO|nr:maltose ABC transporter substrate-binding protein [Bowdeniella nasicola]OKL54075.1 maltose ABC transporter substrate-binding protein [Bowdeniella nasicola]